VLRVRDDVLVVQTLLWPDEVRAAEFSSLDTDVVITDKELKMAISLVDSFAADFNPDDFVDEYRLELQQLIEAKLDGDEAFPTAEADSGEDAEVLDLLAALQRSVERQKSGTSSAAAPAVGDAPQTEAAVEKKAPAKKPVVKKPVARKTAASTTDESAEEKKPRARRPA
jgi:DNA end-binding protein Ku